MHTRRQTKRPCTCTGDGNRKSLESRSNTIWYLSADRQGQDATCARGSETLFVREKIGIMEGLVEAKMVCTFAEDEIMMIKLINDEGHRDNINNEADDNDSVLSAFISF